MLVGTARMPTPIVRIEPSSRWLQVAPQAGGDQTYLYALAVLNNKVYAVTNPGGKLYEWDGSSTLVPVANTLNGQTNMFCMAVFGGKIYAGTGPNGRLFEWNGSNAWNEVATQLGSETFIECLLEFEGELYAGTYPNGRLIKWNGSNAWLPVASKLSSTNITELAIANGKLYGSADGELYELNATKTAWVSVAPKFNGQTTWGLAVLDNVVYAGTYTGGRLHRWNGSNAWEEVAPLLGSESYIYKLLVFRGRIYAGTYPSGNLYRWNGVNAWVKLAGQLNSQIYVLGLVAFNDRIYGGTASGARLFEFTPSLTLPAMLVGTARMPTPIVRIEPSSRWLQVAPQADSAKYIRSLIVFNGKIYGGTANAPTNGCELYEWDGYSKWYLVATRYLTETSVLCLCEFNGDLYAGTTQGRLLKWNGYDAWLERAPMLNNQTEIVSLVAFNGELYGSTYTATHTGGLMRGYQ
jgi:hypothetical protein